MTTTIKTHEPFEVEIFDAFNKLLVSKDAKVQQEDGEYPSITITGTIGGKSMSIGLSLHTGRDAVDLLQFSLNISCSITILLDDVRVVYQSDTSKALAMYMGGKLKTHLEANDKPAKEKAYKAFEELIK